jgi:hypothetical protein
MSKINFVRRFILDFVRMVKPIHSMLNKVRSFSWNDDTEKYFIEIKTPISSPPVLEKTNFEKVSLFTLMPLKKQYYSSKI